MRLRYVVALVFAGLLYFVYFGRLPEVAPVIELSPAPTLATTTTEVHTPPLATTTATKEIEPADATAVLIKKDTVTVPKVVAPPQPTQSEFDATASTLRAALVNILCYSSRTDIPSISGSGVIIDSRGIILTNAHIAQYFLYVGEPSLAVSCTVRAGSPAQNAYRASLMFISPLWVSTNPTIIKKQNPTGNGEYDFAFLAITGSAAFSTNSALPNAPLPSTLSFIPLSQYDAYVHEPVVIGSYAAQFLTSNEIRSSLFPTVVFGSISAIFTFVKTSVDVMTFSGSAAAQEGSSGGGIARVPGALAGLITTSTIEGDTSTRTLGGISSTYIRRQYETEAGHPLADLLAKTPIEAVSDFAPQISSLRATLIAPLSN